jgi:hypothetical protein
MMDESNRVVWAYMIDEGKLTDGTWSFYGGGWESQHTDWRQNDKSNIEFREKVKSVGVDWAKTNPPKSSKNSAFTDTFHDADDVETLLGTIVLKDGSKYTVGVSNADKKFGEYARVVMEYVKGRARVRDVFGE